VLADDDSLPRIFNSKRVKVIKHSDIIPKEYLPTFNSNVIDSYLHKIPGLSEQFLVFNDDTYIGQPTPWTHFFTKTGKPINRHAQGGSRHPVDITTTNMFVRMMQNAIKKYDMNNTRYQHQVQPFCISIISHYERRFATALHKASFNRYRRPNDFNLLRFTTCFSTSEKLASSKYTPESHDFFTESNDTERLNQLLTKKLPRFFCINNTYPKQNRVLEVLKKAFPQQSPFEARM
jgi:hypothetical protein